jgi:hypothetical protein
MGIFNNSDIEKKVLFLQEAIKTNAESCVQLINNQTAIVEDFEKFSVFTKEVFGLIQIRLDTTDKKIESLKAVIDTLIEDNRRLNELAIKNEKRFIETLDAFDKEAEKFKKFYEEVLSEKTKRN